MSFIEEQRKNTIEENNTAQSEFLDILDNLNPQLYDISVREPLYGDLDFSVLKDYLSYLENKRQCLLDEKTITQTKIDHLRTDLVELLKELKMLETLQSKTFKAMKKSANRKEQKNLDAMALRIEERRI